MAYNIIIQHHIMAYNIIIQHHIMAYNINSTSYYGL